MSTGSCGNCGVATTNPSYCSRSCAAIYNNRVLPKRKAKPRPICEECHEMLPPRRKNCPQCYVAPIRSLGNIRHTARYQIYAQVRSHARQVMRGEIARCSLCTYSKHVEVAHIRDISLWPDETLLTEVNHRSNLLPLCPNHHWEFDHDLL